VLAALREAFPARAAEGIDAAQLYVDWDEVREMGANGFTFGNHTCSHPNLERLTDAAQFAEIAGAQQAIAREIGPVTSLAYPFGHHAPDTATIAARAGLTSCGQVGGANRQVAAMAVGRTHIADEDVAGLFARMEVVEPVKARLRALSALRSRPKR
jgi:peptidoglycan/xylan/chitin deacetylase (PgdA/CDA1 family)